MSTQHNPDECARLIAEARKAVRSCQLSGGPCRISGHVLAAMADQLEAQQAEIERLKRDVVTVCNNFRQEQHEHAEASLSRRDLTAERDKLQADVERLERDNRTTRASLEAANEHLRGLLDGAQASLASAQAELEAARREAKAAWEQADILADGLEQACAALVADRGADALRMKLRKFYRDAYRAARDKAERCDSCDWTFPCFAEPTKCIKRPLVNTSDGVFDPESSLEVFDRRRR